MVAIKKIVMRLNQKLQDGLNVEIINFHSWAYRFSGIKFNQTILHNTQIQYISNIINELSSHTSNVLNKKPEFFQEEISWIKGKLFKNKSEYIEAVRSGRGTVDRVSKLDKEVIWTVYQKYNQELLNNGQVDFDDYAIIALRKIQNTNNFIPPYTHIIIDEAQDLNKAQILTISSLVDPETNSLSIIADAAQRIFKSGFTWSEVGINVRGGRTIEFKKNYRNTIPILQAALSLLSKEKDQSDFTKVETAIKGTEKPMVGYYIDFEEQLHYLNEQLTILKKNNNLKSTVILLRSSNKIDHVAEFLNEKNFLTENIKSNSNVNYENNSLKICTMSSIKGLEFNNVIILDLNDEIIPYPKGFVEDDDEFHISTERRLLYTCMTRARNKLCLFSSDKENPSRYLKRNKPKFIRGY